MKRDSEVYVNTDDSPPPTHPQDTVTNIKIIFLYPIKTTTTHQQFFLKK